MEIDETHPRYREIILRTKQEIVHREALRCEGQSEPLTFLQALRVLCDPVLNPEAHRFRREVAMILDMNTELNDDWLWEFLHSLSADGREKHLVDKMRQLALERCDTMSEAAKLLGVCQRTLSSGNRRKRRIHLVKANKA